MPAILNTSRLQLRPVEITDARAITHAVQNPAIYRNVARIAPGQTLEQTLAWLSRVDADPDDNNHVFVVTLHDTLIGLIGAHRDTARRPFEIGYWLAEEAFGRGFATEAAGAVIGWLEARGERAFTAGYFADNPASGRVLRKLGFLPSGRGKIDCLGRGEKVDHFLMARLS